MSQGHISDTKTYRKDPLTMQIIKSSKTDMFNIFKESFCFNFKLRIMKEWSSTKLS